MRKMRWGILSTAHIAQSAVIPAIQQAENAEVVAIASLSGKEKAVAKVFDIPKTYDHYDALLDDPEIDAVYIPLPNHLHYEWVVKAAKKGKHILCEKPLALNADEAAEMFKVCRDNQVYLMEAFMYQFHPQHDRVREIIRSGEIGDVQLMRSAFTFFMKDMATNIRMKYKDGGGSLYDVGCYCIHVTRTILGREPKEVQAVAEIDPKSGVDTSAFAYMAFDGNVRATFDCGFHAAHREEYEVVGTKGRILVPYAFRPDNHRDNGVLIIDKDGERRKETVSGRIYVNEIEYFSESVTEKKSPIYTEEATINNMRVIDMCYQSIKR